MMYRKKPVTIEAMQWNGENYDEVKTFLAASFICVWINTGTVGIRTPNGTAYAEINEWIIKDIYGGYVTCNDKMFNITYEEVA